MRYSFMAVAAVTLGLLARPALAQVAPVATMGGMGNASIGAGNMGVGATVANGGANVNHGLPQNGMGGGNVSTAEASRVGAAGNIAGVVGGPRAVSGGFYYGQNNNTAVGMNMAASAVANQPGQPFALNRSRSMFNSGGNTQNYNPALQARYGGVNNGMGYGGQRSGGNVAGYGSAAGPAYNGAPAYRPSNVNVAGYGGFTGPAFNGMPMFGQDRSYNGAAAAVNGPLQYRPSTVDVPGYAGFTGPAFNGLPMFGQGRSFEGGAGSGAGAYGQYGNGAGGGYPLTNGAAAGAY